LKKLLLSKHITRRNRAFTIERQNGKDTVVVARPSWKDPNSFVWEADCSKWVDKLLPDATYVNGMCMYLAAKHSENYKKVAELYSLKVQKRVPTTKTLAIASEVRLGDMQLQKLRQYLKLEGVLLELSHKVIDKIDQEVGIRTETDPIFGEYEHFEVSKEPQVCQFFNTRLDEDICCVIEGHLFKLILSPSDGAAVSEILSLDYCAPSNEKGITILLGGDHGDRYFPFHAKIHLTSPMERKKRRNLSYECPIVQITCCECAKDKYIVLNETVMPRLESNIAKVQASCAIILYDGTDIKAPRKVYLVPKGINVNTVTLLDGGLGDGDGGGGGIQFHVTRQSEPVTIPFLGRSPITRVKRWNLRVKKIVSNFYDFYIGDIAFLATILGMEGSEA
jgi:hypothetical protein